ncbi:hypothetical membrane protein [Pelotomaculum thermopropionicum SI]|uniref:Hypothetical membrane protein n=1 Tax=Pelotomaculum thermopropionicum (strain DSM 13744 / JCM 10971 / SI) TaxID=370438 RepID=A5D2V8_PELTS|nr:hypothetical membrane protein [Pelotomaculum thermopropionicum SI]
MTGVYIAAVLTVFFLTGLFMTVVRLCLHYERRGRDDEMALELSVWRGLLSYRLKIPVAEVKKPEIRPVTRFGPLLRAVPRPVFKIMAELSGRSGRPLAKEKRTVAVPGPAKIITSLCQNLSLLKRYGPAIKYLLKRVRLRRFRWLTEIGARDPARSGVITGLAWAAKGYLLPLICRLFSPGGARPQFAVRPSFEKPCFNSVLDCIFEVRIGHIIFAGFKALAIKMKQQ